MKRIPWEVIWFTMEYANRPPLEKLGWTIDEFYDYALKVVILHRQQANNILQAVVHRYQDFFRNVGWSQKYNAPDWRIDPERIFEFLEVQPESV